MANSKDQKCSFRILVLVVLWYTRFNSLAVQTKVYGSLMIICTPLNPSLFVSVCDAKKKRGEEEESKKEKKKRRNGTSVGCLWITFKVCNLPSNSLQDYEWERKAKARKILIFVVGICRSQKKRNDRLRVVIFEISLTHLLLHK